MKITSVNVKKDEHGNSRMVGKATVVLDECFMVRNIRIIAKDDGGFIIAMPSIKVGEGQYKDMAHPLNQETRKMFEEAILEEYNKVKDNEEEASEE
jgi:stage V sporulation protein G